MQHKTSPDWKTWLVWGCALAPLALALLWGAPRADSQAYAALHQARIATTAVHQSYIPIGQSASTAVSPLWVLALTFCARQGWPLETVSLILGGLGWSALIGIVYTLACRCGQPRIGLAFALLCATHPLIYDSAGTATGWYVTGVVGMVAALTGGHSLQQLLAALLGLSLQPDPLMLVLALMLLARYRPCQGRASTLVAITSCGVALALVKGVIGLPLAPHTPRLDLTFWAQQVHEWLWPYPFYWGGALLALLGLTQAPRLWLAALAGIGALAFWGSGANGYALLYTLGLLLAARGAEQMRSWMERREWLRQHTALAMGMVLALLPLLVAQSEVGITAYRTRPLAHQHLEAQAAAWLRDHTAPDDAVVGSAPLTYAADRNALVWEADAHLPRDRWAAFLKQLRYLPARFWTTAHTPLEEAVTRQGWFLRDYYPVHILRSPYDPLAPLTLWQKNRMAFKAHQSMEVRLPSWRYWRAYDVNATHITPGMPLSVTLYFHDPLSLTATTPLTTEIFLKATKGGFQFRQNECVARIYAPYGYDGLWAEQYVMTTPVDLPSGAYYLSASVWSHDPEAFDFIYEGDSVFPINRVTLGYVVAPWRSDLTGMQPVSATLGERFALRGYMPITTPLQAGGMVEVRLIWEGRSSTYEAVEGDYYVFVHLLDSNGAIVAQHDGPPMAGRYPAAAWLAGDLVPDTHTLTLPAELPPGTYRLQTGIYHWPSLERQMGQDAAGQALPDGVIGLQTLEVAP